MGVNGLWQVLQPCARPTNLATLNRKRLAVDASIWIYQFLKAVRDKEGNALRNSHVVGFFRRICKLLWFGILPVFVFDGGAPALKRATLQGRRRRREGRREDATRTANRLLAVQMKRLAEEEAAGLSLHRSRRDNVATAAGAADALQTKRLAEEEAGIDGVAEGEVIPTGEDLVYADEQLLSRAERQQTRAKFHKKDAYHLPELDRSMHEMGRPNDPRVMSIDQLEEYARQFHRGEDINLYDFSKIDFDGDFFKSLPQADRYNILNAARIRSRLRMGLSKEQLDRMFPDRRAFSRFQVERVQERNRLTQRLMLEMGMTGSTDLTVGGRINSERGREYILVKNEGAEGGWALGVVTREKDKGEMHNPIDVDALQRSAAGEDGGEDDDDDDDDDDFEDVPIEGLNRLPKLRAASGHEVESMFVDQDDGGLSDAELFGAPGLNDEATLAADEQEDIDRAIALSLKNQHDGAGSSKTLGHSEVGLADSGGFEDPENAPPHWTQRAAETHGPLTKASGRAIAHMVNNRAGRIVPRPKKSVAVNDINDGDDSSDSDADLQSALATARKRKQREAASQAGSSSAHAVASSNSFGGPLPFEKLDWRRTSGAMKPPAAPNVATLPTPVTITLSSAAVVTRGSGLAIEDHEEEEESAGGFLTRPAPEADGPRPLPPWMMDYSDIRESIQNQRRTEADINAQDRELVIEQERRYRREMQDKVVEIASSPSEDGGDDSDVEIIDAPAPPPVPDAVSTAAGAQTQTTAKESTAVAQTAEYEQIQSRPGAEVHSPDYVASWQHDGARRTSTASPSPEVEFEDVEIPTQMGAKRLVGLSTDDAVPQVENGPVLVVAPSKELRDAVPEGVTNGIDENAEFDDAFFDNAEFDKAEFENAEEFDDFGDSEDEELLVQMAEEAEEHARFASTLNHKPAHRNATVSYEQELRQLRQQQKKDRRDADEVTQVMVTECQALLRLFGIPYVTAPMEAEAQCAELVRLGLVDGIVTDDSDTFLFGGTRVYKNMFNGNKFVECYLASDLERELSLSRENLISLAQLLGSDYADGLPGVGPVTAVEILSEFPGPDGLQRFRDWWNETQLQHQQGGARNQQQEVSAFRRKFRRSQATRLFLAPGFPNPAVPEAYLRPEVDSDPQPFQWGVPDLEGLRSFLTETIGWAPERTDEVLVPVIRDMNKRGIEGTQSNITRFLSGGVGVGAREAFAPTRRQAQGSRRMADAVLRLRAGTDRSPGAGVGSGIGAGAGTGDQLDQEQAMAPPSRSSKSAAGQKRKARGSAAPEDDDVAGDGALVDGVTIGGEANGGGGGGGRKRGGKAARVGRGR